MFANAETLTQSVAFSKLGQRTPLAGDNPKFECIAARGNAEKLEHPQQAPRLGLVFRISEKSRGIRTRFAGPMKTGGNARTEFGHNGIGASAAAMQLNR